MTQSTMLRRKTTASLRSQWEAQIDDHVIALAWSPRDGEQIAVASVSGPVTIFDRKRGVVRYELSGHSFGATALAWRPDGAVLASAGQDGKVRLWDVNNGTQLDVLDGGAAWVEHVTWCPVKGGKQPPWLAAAAGKVLRIWASDGHLLQEHSDHTSTIADLQWHVGRNELAYAPYGGVILLNPDQPESKRCFRWQGASLKLAWSPDGNYVATGDQDSTVHFWYSKSGEDLQMWGYPTKVRELAWDRTSRYLATGGGPTVVVWDCSGKGPEGTKPLMLEAHRDFLSDLAYQRNGPLLASAGNDAQVVLWAPGREKRPLTDASCNAAVTRVAWSPDDRFLAAGTAEGEVKVYSVTV